MQAAQPLQTTRRQHGIMPPQSGPEMQMLAHQSAVFSDSCCLPPPPPSYTRSGGSGSDTSSSRLPGIQLDVVKRLAAVLLMPVCVPHQQQEASHRWPL